MLHCCGTRPGGSVCLVVVVYILATCKVAPRCVQSRSWGLYDAASLGYQTASTMTCYHTQPHYRKNDPTSPHFLIMQSAEVGSDKYQIKGHWFDLTRICTLEVQFRNCEVQIP